MRCVYDVIYNVYVGMRRVGGIGWRKTFTDLCLCLLCVRATVRLVGLCVVRFMRACLCAHTQELELWRIHHAKLLFFVGGRVLCTCVFTEDRMRRCASDSVPCTVVLQ